MNVFFDMRRTGRTIARLRRERNLSQMALADRIGVSYQAVSNWERGQSMPDIAKLPDLATILGTTIDELLGRNAPLIAHAAAGTLTGYIQTNTPAAGEVAEAAPLLQPDQVDCLTDRLLGLTQPADDPHFPPPEDIAFDDLTALLPFLSTEKVNLILRSLASRQMDCSPLFPFASDDQLALLAREAAEAGNMDRLLCLAPFLNKDVLDGIALFLPASNQDITGLLPFLSDKILRQIALERLRHRESVTTLLPFLDEAFLSSLADAASRAND